VASRFVSAARLNIYDPLRGTEETQAFLKEANAPLGLHFREMPPSPPSPSPSPGFSPVSVRASLRVARAKGRAIRPIGRSEASPSPRFFFRSIASRMKRSCARSTTSRFERGAISARCASPLLFLLLILVASSDALRVTRDKLEGESRHEKCRLNLTPRSPEEEFPWPCCHKSYLDQADHSQISNKARKSTMSRGTRRARLLHKRKRKKKTRISSLNFFNAQRRRCPRGCSQLVANLVREIGPAGGGKLSIAPPLRE